MVRAATPAIPRPSRAARRRPRVGRSPSRVARVRLPAAASPPRSRRLLATRIARQRADRDAGQHQARLTRPAGRSQCRTPRPARRTRRRTPRPARGSRTGAAAGVVPGGDDAGGADGSSHQCPVSTDQDQPGHPGHPEAGEGRRAYGRRAGPGPSPPAAADRPGRRRCRGCRRSSRWRSSRPTCSARATTRARRRRAGSAPPSNAASPVAATTGEIAAGRVRGRAPSTHWAGVARRGGDPLGGGHRVRSCGSVGSIRSVCRRRRSTFPLLVRGRRSQDRPAGGEQRSRQLGARPRPAGRRRERSVGDRHRPRCPTPGRGTPTTTISAVPRCRPALSPALDRDEVDVVARR